MNTPVSRTTIAYIDRNALSHLRLYRRGISPQDEATIRAAIRRGDLAVPLSIVTLSETLLMNDVKQALNEVRWIIELTGRDRVINDAVPLLNACLRAYADNATPASPYVTSLDLARVTSPTKRDLGALLKTMLVYKGQRTAWVEGWNRNLETWSLETPRYPEFNDFLRAHAPGWLETMADRAGAGVREKCEQRGWNRLLTLKTIRLGVVVPMILAHAKMFKERDLEEADFGDLHHVITATCAEVFVTHDPRLRALIHRAHVPDLEVLTVPQLVQQLNLETLS